MDVQYHIRVTQYILSGEARSLDSGMSLYYEQHPPNFPTTTVVGGIAAAAISRSGRWSHCGATFTW